MPAPTVLPPSRIAKPSPASSATGLPSTTVMSTLSPGDAVRDPPKSTSPTTLVVRTKNCGRYPVLIGVRRPPSAVRS